MSSESFYLYLPFVYIVFIILPFTELLGKFLFSKKTLYDDCILIFIDIDPFGDFENMYYKDKSFSVTCYLENENKCEDESTKQTYLFGNIILNNIEFDDYLYDLKGFVEHCKTNLKKKPFIILNTPNINMKTFFMNLVYKK